MGLHKKWEKWFLRSWLCVCIAVVGGTPTHAQVSKERKVSTRHNSVKSSAEKLAESLETNLSDDEIAANYVALAKALTET